MRSQLVIFDFDGTLADSAPWLAGELNRAARRFRFREVDERERELLRGMDTRSVLRSLGIPAWKVPLIARHMRRRVAEDAASIPLFPGTPALLERLARQAPLAIASSNAEQNIRRILGSHARHIGRYACGVSLFGKARQFRRLIREARADPRAVLCIGDELRDIEAARAAGARSVAVTWGYAARDLLAGSGPDLLVDTVEELIARLEAMTGKP